MERMGLLFTTSLEQAWSGSQSVDSGGAGPVVTEWSVPLGKPFLDIRRCMDQRTFSPLKPGVGRWFPDHAWLSQIKLGPVLFMTWPGEPTSELGLELRAAAEQAGALDAWVLGLTNGHLGYFTSPWDHDLGGYETCVNFYGRMGGATLRDSHLARLSARSF
jgi:hypothetical protein